MWLLKVALTPAPCLAGKFFWYLLIVFLTLSYYTYYGMVSLQVPAHAAVFALGRS